MFHQQPPLSADASWVEDAWWPETNGSPSSMVTGETQFGAGEATVTRAVDTLRPIFNSAAISVSWPLRSGEVDTVAPPISGMFLLAITFCLVAAVLAADPTRPVPPESFGSKVVVEFHFGQMNRIGEGVWEIDQPNGRAMENYTFEGHNDSDVFHLQRFDLHKEFNLDSLNKTNCHVNPLNGTFQPIWAWVAQAKYSGVRKVRSVDVDTWTTQVAGTTFTIGVEANAQNPNAPYFWSSHDSRGDFFVIFNQFTPGAPPEKDFAVPTVCAQ